MREQNQHIHLTPSCAVNQTCIDSSLTLPSPPHESMSSAVRSARNSMSIEHAHIMRAAWLKTGRNRIRGFVGTRQSDHKTGILRCLVNGDPVNLVRYLVGKHFLLATCFYYVLCFDKYQDVHLERYSRYDFFFVTNPFLLNSSCRFS